MTLMRRVPAQKQKKQYSFVQSQMELGLNPTSVTSMSLIITSLDLSFLFGKMKTKISTFLWVFVKMRNDMWALLLPNRGKQSKWKGLRRCGSGGTGSCLDWISALHASCSTMSYKSLNIKHCLCEHRVGTRGNHDKWGSTRSLRPQFAETTGWTVVWFYPRSMQISGAGIEKVAFGLDLGLEFWRTNAKEE